MKNIYVTKPALPPIEEYIRDLRKIWHSGIITNNGPFHQQFEEELAKYLGVKYISLFNNGTLALITALQALRITGEVITTPFSFVATTHSLWWNNIKPVFVDIEPDFLNIDPKKIESAITSQTTAILPVHVYGNPCNTDAIQRISDTYGLKVIYDAAHAFGVRKANKSILNYGDLSVMSFHATKTFNTIEGGAIVCHSEEMKRRIDFLKNFGFESETSVVAPGINAKMNELQAAFGLLQLKYVDSYISRRKEIAKIYRTGLKGIPGIRVLNDIKGVRHSYPYFPIFINPDEFGYSRDFLYNKFRDENIFARRYFYPLISHFPTYQALPSAAPDNLPVANIISDRVLCLPLYPELNNETVLEIIEIIKKLSG